jgi:tetratricopeptide (TPR) repeat protein
VPDLAEIVADIRWRLDVSTLQEVVDHRENLRQVAERLAAPLDVALDTLNKVRVLCLRAEVDRLLGDVDRAAATARLALAHGESGDEPQAVALARAELAQVLRLCGEYGEADVLFDAVVNADVPDSVRSVAHENAGRCCVDQGRYLEAFDHFGRAMRLGDPEDLDLVGRLEVCLDAVHIRVLRDGWGPSPRLRAEILAAAVADRP